MTTSSGDRTPFLRLMAGKVDIDAEPLVGESTLQRLEANDGAASRYSKITYWRDAMDELLVDLFLEAHAPPPAEIVLDIDNTDVELHGGQEGRFVHGYYDEYCYLPLYIFCGEHLLGVRLRSANIEASAGSLREIARIVGQIRQRWPRVGIILRGDSGFCRDEMSRWGKQNQVDFVFGFARNQRLRRLLAEAIDQAAHQYEQTQMPARMFVEFPYQTTTGSWEQKRRVVAKAEYIDGKENPRYEVTSLPAESWPAQRCMNNCTARATWRTGSTSSSRCSPSAPAPKPCARINCGCICRRWPTCWCAVCAAWD